MPTNIRPMSSSQGAGRKRIILGVTGASGAWFARRTLAMLEADARVEEIHLVISGSGLRLLRDELDLEVSKSAEIPAALAGRPTPKTEYLLDSDIGASIASGSYAVDGMVVIPCTTGCLAQIAAGISDTLIERAADVCLKQSCKLILAVRDAPFNRIHLENMLRAQAAGIPVCLTVTHVDALVLARRGFNHSINYRSVVVLGTATLVEGGEKLDALHAFSEHVVPGRWDEARRPAEQELKATWILSLPLTEASAKVRSGPPEDEREDAGLPVWGGVVPIHLAAEPPIPDAHAGDAVPYAWPRVHDGRLGAP